MDTCILCLKSASAFHSYIPINSHRWRQCDILGIIEKHFWPIDNLPTTIGICFPCWSKLNNFHIFYQNIEEAHCRNEEISKEKIFTNACIEQKTSQTSFEVDEPKLGANGEKKFSCDTFCDNLKTENGFEEYEQKICEILTNTSDQIASNPISTEKRKRGRPRKYHIKQELHQKKPKTKRGRPRKDSKIATPVATLPQIDSTEELQSSPQCTFVTAVSNNSPPKKKKRGRPRKTPKNNENSSEIQINKLPVPDSDAVSAKTSSQDEPLTNDKFSNLNESVKIVNKKQKLISLMKKRKQAKQHKTLMRNYIATSMRCMKFFKK